MAEVESAKKRCMRVIEKIQMLQNRTNKITASSQRTLFKLAFSELTFLSRPSSPSTSLCVNIGHIEAVLHILQQPFITGVSRVCKPIPFATTALNVTKSDFPKSVYVDIVCTLNGNPVWIIVSDRNPKYISWDESLKSKGLKLRIKEALEAARSSVALKPASIVLFFSRGLSSGIYENVKDEFGAEDLSLEFSVFDYDLDDDLESDWVNIVARTYREALILEIKINDVKNSDSNPVCAKDSILGAAEPGLSKGQIEKITGGSFVSLISSMTLCSLEEENEKNSSGNKLGKADFVNLDTTALIALVSGISNGGAEKLLAAPEAETRQRFKGNYNFVIGQVMSEIQNPIHMELRSALSEKRGIICQSVCSEFKELVMMHGGHNEKSRAEQLIRCLMVVADSPSERMMSLPTTRKLALKTKIVFGTGDRWQAPTLTANMAFVRAISQTGMSLFTIGHKPRALTGD